MTTIAKMKSYTVQDSLMVVSCVIVLTQDDGRKSEIEPWATTLVKGMNCDRLFANLAKHCSADDLAKVRAVFAAL